ncbi:MAG TPA: SAM-dependent methyltransferase [Thermosulfurimonas dismutans]|uniref:SAM-dependent methyltransferase n=1 Tax=Thermosulfurimonas dismutans TaxID=999894 RepID=A0A7C3CFM1_9BACT|nr:SAM-dependent methyltransferase [Thermosulfurimonas dismutans]
MKPDFSRDVLFEGRLTVYQPREGYRFSVEALLLAEFVRFRRRELAVELGAGCGVISALLALRFPGARIVALEIQELLIQALGLTVRENGLSDRVFPVKGDVRRIPLRSGIFSAVVANPPFKPPESGRLPPDESHLLARTETLATLSDFLRVARYLLKTGGRFFLVHTAHRAVEVLCGLREFGLEPKRLRWVYPRPGDEARFLLVEAIKGAAPEVRVDPPFFIHPDSRPGPEPVSRP